MVTIPPAALALIILLIIFVLFLIYMQLSKVFFPKQYLEWDKINAPRVNILMGIVFLLVGSLTCFEFYQFLISHSKGPLTPLRPYGIIFIPVILFLGAGYLAIGIYQKIKHPKKKKW